MGRTGPRVIVTFYTTAGAMAAEAACVSRGVPGRLIPAPRAISADCGIAWSSPPERREAVVNALDEAGVEYAGVHTLEI